MRLIETLSIKSLHEKYPIISHTLYLLQNKEFMQLKQQGWPRSTSCSATIGQRSQTTSRGSLSAFDRTTETLSGSRTASLSLNTARKPRSLLLWSVRMTLVLFATASSTSWCDISPKKKQDSFLYFFFLNNLQVTLDKKHLTKMSAKTLSIKQLISGTDNCFVWSSTCNVEVRLDSI